MKLTIAALSLLLVVGLFGGLTQMKAISLCGTYAELLLTQQLTPKCISPGAPSMSSQEEKDRAQKVSKGFRERPWGLSGILKRLSSSKEDEEGKEEEKKKREEEEQKQGS